MGIHDSSERLTHKELAWELVEVFDGLETDQINEVLAKNVPLDTLQFFASYSEDFGRIHSVDDAARKQLANLLLLGYLLRVLEDRLIPEAEPFDA
jgi:hypothetical protein